MPCTVFQKSWKTVHVGNVIFGLSGICGYNIIIQLHCRKLDTVMTKIDFVSNRIVIYLPYTFHYIFEY